MREGRIDSKWNLVYYPVFPLDPLDSHFSDSVNCHGRNSPDQFGIVSGVGK